MWSEDTEWAEGVLETVKGRGGGVQTNGSVQRA